MHTERRPCQVDTYERSKSQTGAPGRIFRTRAAGPVEVVPEVPNLVYVVMLLVPDGSVREGNVLAWRTLFGHGSGENHPRWCRIGGIRLQGGVHVPAHRGGPFLCRHIHEVDHRILDVTVGIYVDGDVAQQDLELRVCRNRFGIATEPISAEFVYTEPLVLAPQDSWNPAAPTMDGDPGGHS